MLKRIVIVFLLALALSGPEPVAPAIAHDGHDHGNEAPVAATRSAPRAAVASEDFEVVVAAADGRLIIYVDHFATNEPVVGATIELIENDVTTKAVETAGGVYTLAGWSRAPGSYSLMIAIESDAKSDLLPLTLEIPQPEAPVSSGYPVFWIVIGQTAAIATLALVLAVLYLRATRRFDYVLDSGVRLSGSALLLSTTFPQGIESVRTRRLGPALVTDRLWDETGCASAIRDAAGPAGFGFSAERAIYATVLQRMFDNEPNRPLREWLEDHVVVGADKITDAHLATAIEWLGREAEGPMGKARPGRTTKDLIEETLFSKRAESETGLDLVFFHTLPVPLATNGNGRKQPRKVQTPPAMAVGVVLDASGYPLCFELWPGGTADTDALLQAIDRLQARFDIRRVCLVSDLGAAKPATIDAFSARGIQFILALRDSEAHAGNGRRSDREPSASAGAADDTAIDVKDVEPDEAWTPEPERLIVCSENAGAGRQSTTSETGAPAQTRELGPKKSLLRTNTDLPPSEVVSRYRQLLVVEETFHAAKAILDMRTIPSVGETVVRGHMFCSFLALLLRREIEIRLDAAGLSLNWRDVVRDLNRLAETEIVQAGRRFVIRNEPSSNALGVADALSIVFPPTIERREDDDASPVTLEALALPSRLRSGAIRIGNAAVARAERKVREAGEWLGRQQ